MGESHPFTRASDEKLIWDFCASGSVLHRQNSIDSVRVFKRHFISFSTGCCRFQATRHEKQKRRANTLAQIADGLQLDYTDVYAFTDAVSYMIGTNLGNTQALIGQV